MTNDVEIDQLEDIILIDGVPHQLPLTKSFKFGEYRLAIPKGFKLIKENKHGSRDDQEQSEQAGMAQAYRVIGNIVANLNIDHPEIERALDYFCECKYDEDFLPWGIDDDNQRNPDGSEFNGVSGSPGDAS